MRDDVTDGVAIRRRTAMWRWVLSVVVAAILAFGDRELATRQALDRNVALEVPPTT